MSGTQSQNLKNFIFLISTQSNLRLSKSNVSNTYYLLLAQVISYRMFGLVYLRSLKLSKIPTKGHIFSNLLINPLIQVYRSSYRASCILKEAY